MSLDEELREVERRLAALKARRGDPPAIHYIDEDFELPSEPREGEEFTFCAVPRHREVVYDSEGDDLNTARKVIATGKFRIVCGRDQSKSNGMIRAYFFDGEPHPIYVLTLKAFARVRIWLVVFKEGTWPIDH